MPIEFREFSKIPRFSREIIVTEKIDGTNASINIVPIAKTYWDDQMLSYFYGPDASTWAVYAGSRTRWITPKDDNFGFAKWVEDNLIELKKLGPGHHFGEWWGRGIQRGYGLEERRFSLFNVGRWVGRQTTSEFPFLPDGAQIAPLCCHVVPILYRGLMDTPAIDTHLGWLLREGSRAAPGFMKPEGVVVCHTASGHLFKKTCEHDDEPKGARVKKERSPQTKPVRSLRRVQDLPIDFTERRKA